MLLIVALSACARPHTLVVLFPEPDGTVGRVEVSNPAGSQVLERAGQAVRVSAADQAPSPPEPIGGRKINSLFGPALNAQPELPAPLQVYFILGSSQPTRESREQLPGIVAGLRTQAPLRLRVVGHADRLGSDALNFRLALKRAEMVKAYLVRNGFDAERIETDSHGEANPQIPTPDEVPEPRNRRAEILAY